MKIAVQGIIIETDHIYAISEIEKKQGLENNYTYFEFTINFLNRKSINFKIKWPGNLSRNYYDSKSQYSHCYYLNNEQGYTNDPDFINNHPTTQEAKQALNTLRQFVVDNWSESQLQIPFRKVITHKIHVNGLGD